MIGLDTASLEPDLWCKFMLKARVIGSTSHNPSKSLSRQEQRRILVETVFIFDGMGAC